MSDDTPAPARVVEPLPATAKSRIVCSCGWVTTGRSPEASGDGYRDHIAFAHATALPEAIA